MQSANFGEFVSRWRGSLSYLAVSAVAGAINSWSLNRLSDRSDSVLRPDLLNLSNALMVVLVASVTLVFVHGRRLSPGTAFPLRHGLGLSVFAAVCAGSLAGSFVDSTGEFRLEIGALIGAAAFLTLAPTARIASFLAGLDWAPVCLWVAMSAVVRALVWETAWFSGSLQQMMTGVIVSQGIALVPLAVFRCSGVTRDERGGSFSGSMAVTATGFLVSVAAASVSRSAVLGSDKKMFVEVSAATRSVFLLALAVAFSVFPYLCRAELFSSEMGRRMREAQVLVVSVVSLFTAVVIAGLIWDSTPWLPTIEALDEATLVLLLSVGWCLMAFSLVPILYFVAHGSRFGMVTVVPAMVLVAGQIVSRSATELATWFATAAVLLAVIVTVPAQRRSRPRIRAASGVPVVGIETGASSVSMVVPSFNSGKQGHTVVMQLGEVLERVTRDFEVIAVSDGSTDESPELFDSIDKPWFSHVRLEKNKGKGGALREGFKVSRNDIVGFIDADGDIPPSVVPGMLGAMISNEADVVFGSKRHPESSIVTSPARRFVSRTQTHLQSILFRIDVDDTQTGVKLFSRAMLRDVEPSLTENGYALDLEIFVSAVAHGHTKFLSWPVVIDRRGESTVNGRAMVKTVVDMLRIFWRSRVELQYDALAYHVGPRRRGES